MKKRLRIVGLALATAMVLAVPVSHHLRGAPPAGTKRLICHFDEDGTGRVLEVGAAAIEAHCAHHTGDYTGATPPATVTLVKGATCARITNPVCR
jgi:hypothetical protein